MYYMRLLEVIDLLNNKHLNSKCNNFIITKCREKDINFILERIRPECYITPSISVDLQNEIGSNSLENVFIDVSRIKIMNFLNVTLEMLKINKNLDFSKQTDLFRFLNILKEYNKPIQWIITGTEELNLNEQYLFNEIMWLNTYFFNANVITREDNLVSYFLAEDRVLDNRDNYQKIALIR